MELSDNQIVMLMSLTEKQAKQLLDEEYDKNGHKWWYSNNGKLYRELQHKLCYLMTDCGVTLKIDQLRFMFYHNRLNYSAK